MPEVIEELLLCAEIIVYIIITLLMMGVCRGAILRRRTWDATEVKLLVKAAELAGHEVRIWP